MRIQKPGKPQRRPIAGFTLTELMVTIVIIAVLASLAFLGAKRGIASARVAKNMARIKDLGTIFTTYAADYGHYPPGWDNKYGLGPSNRNGTPMNGRGPDLVNAYMDLWEINDRWLSPNLESQLVGYDGNVQPTNYSGHPGLCYNRSGPLKDPLPKTVVSRPSEIFLLLDGIPKSDDNALNSQTSIRQWENQINNSNRSQQNRLLPVTPKEGKERNGPDFRNRGKCHVLFCDGHVETFGPKDFKVKHVALRF